VLIVHGGPATGKSVVAIKLLAAFIARHGNLCGVAKKSAPRAVYVAKLTGRFLERASATCAADRAPS